MPERLMTERAEKETRGAWIIHHGRKISLDLSAPSEFPVLDESAKAADLLMRLAQSDEATLSAAEIDAVARAAGLNPRSELPHYLDLLVRRRLIEKSTGGEVRVLGLTSRATLSHASDILADAGPTVREKASIYLSESTSHAPLNINDAAELIGDIHKMSSAESKDFIKRSIDVGFVDFEGENDDGLLFNGNLFKRIVLQSRKECFFRFPPVNNQRSRSLTISSSAPDACLLDKRTRYWATPYLRN
jgi:hypothetical protein